MMQPTPFGTGVERFRDVGPRALRLDWVLLFATLALLAISVVTLDNATRNDVPGSPDYYAVRQILYAVIGLALMLVVARFDYSRLRELKIGLYVATIVGILLVLGVGGATRGSRRWLDFPFFKFQPSELGKVLLVLALSAFIVDRYRRQSERDTTARIVLLGLIPAMLVVLQPDIGTAMVYVVITVTVLFVAGTKWTHLAALGAAAAGAVTLALVVMPAIGHPVLKGYQEKRLTAFLNPGEETSTSGYQQNQAVIAIGSGRRTGRGPEKASQTQLDFLPEHHTDFIYSVVGEQYGFVGAAIVLGLFAILIWRGLRILTIAKNLFGALVAGGIVAMLMFQVFVAVGMAVRIAPITGLPLPLLSYGGSSVIVTLLAIGLLQSIYVQGRGSMRTKSAV